MVSLYIAQKNKLQVQILDFEASSSLDVSSAQMQNLLVILALYSVVNCLKIPLKKYKIIFKYIHMQ